MRMEELFDNNFIKKTDSIERYLLDIIRYYFNSNNIDEDSREYIIKKAVEQMKEELDIDNAGVVSVNGRTGEVTIDLDELGGEPLISPKLSAFNVNFGTEKNTACMGDDPRLTDDRHPLKHYHNISEINGLSGELSTIKNNIKLLDNTTHKHDNLKLLNKLIYSGTKTEIDLTVLDNFENNISSKIINAEKIITEEQTKINKLITDITKELEQYDDDYNEIKSYTDEKLNELKDSTKEYCDKIFDTNIKEINKTLDNKINKNQFINIINIINQQFKIIYETTVSNFIISNNFDVQYSFKLPDEIINALSILNEEEYKIEFYINYTDPVNNKNTTTNLPFIYIDSGQIIYTIKSELIDKSSVRITSNREKSNTWAGFINSSVIKIRISIKNNLEV